MLSDPEKRRVVDLGGDPLGNGAGAGAGGGDPFSAFGFGDIMDAFFGGQGGGGRGRGPRSRIQPGADALIRMRPDARGVRHRRHAATSPSTPRCCAPECTGSGCAPGSAPAMCDICDGRGEVQSVQRSFLGQVVTSRPCPNCRGFGEVIPEPCRQCGGDGRVRSRRTVGVRIPAGVADGMRVRLAGQGEVGPGGGPAGDLYVEVEEEPHELFTRDGADLHCTVQLPMTAAALGTTLPLPTLDGKEELHVEPGTQAGTVRTLRGKGMPRLRSTGRVDGHGDLMVHVDVVVPTQPRARSRPSCCASSPPCAARSSPTSSAATATATASSRGSATPSGADRRGGVSTPPLFLVDALPAGDSLVLDGPEGRHAATVRRLRAGEDVLLGDGRGQLAQPWSTPPVATAGRLTLTGRVTLAPARPPRAARPGPGQGRPRVSWPSSSPPRPASTPCCRGVRRGRVARWDDGPRGAQALDRWRSTAREAAKQARRAWVPAVEDPVDTSALARRVATSAAALVLHEAAADGLAGIALPTSGELLLVVGPEGGVTDAELDELVAAGARAVRLGAEVLRASTAAAVALGALGVLTERWSGPMMSEDPL